jgi:two-component system sensor histidine kinase YesM
LLVTDIPDSLYDEKVLKLILQPLVENALYHGLNYCAQGDSITIHAERNSFGPGGNVLKITVLDNGQGISEKTLKQIQLKLKEEAKFTELGHRNKQSIGLKNIHSRIELYYGMGYGLQVESRQDQGTCITILIPVTGG